MSTNMDIHHQRNAGRHRPKFLSQVRKQNEFDYEADPSGDEKDREGVTWPKRQAIWKRPLFSPPHIQLDPAFMQFSSEPDGRGEPRLL